MHVPFKSFSEMIDTDADNDGVFVLRAFYDAINDKASTEWDAAAYRKNHVRGRKRDVIEDMTPFEVLAKREAATCCDVCGTNFTDAPTHINRRSPKEVEHNGFTNKFRGIACQPCNRFVSRLEELARDSRRAKQAIEYLKRTDPDSPVTKIIS